MEGPLLSRAEKSVIKKGPSLVDQKLNALSNAMQSAQQSFSSSIDARRHSKDIPAIVRYQDSQAALNLIDEIHDESNEKISKGIPLLSDKISQCVKRNEQPCNMDNVLRVSLIDARRKEEHKQGMLCEADFITNNDAK